MTTVVNGGSASEVQELVLNATGGVFKLSYKGDSTDFITVDASAGDDERRTSRASSTRSSARAR